MRSQPGGCPKTRRQLIDEYFIENRTMLLDVAAFLDRLDRAARVPEEPDFRMEAFDEALRALALGRPGRAKTIQMIFSDPTTEPLERLDRQSARGAYDRRKEAC